MFTKLKYAWQRAVRGYDDQIYWDIHTQLNRMRGPIKEICTRNIKILDTSEHEPYINGLAIITKLESLNRQYKQLTKKKNLTETEEGRLKAIYVDFWKQEDVYFDWLSKNLNKLWT